MPDNMHDSAVPIIRKSRIEKSPWYKRLAERPWLAVAYFVAFVLIAAGTCNLASCIF
jgi:hypothetical protein